MAKNSGGTRGAVNGHSYAKSANSEVDNASVAQNDIEVKISKLEKSLAKANSDLKDYDDKSDKYNYQYRDLKKQADKAGIEADRYDTRVRALDLSIHSAAWAGNYEKRMKLEKDQNEAIHNRAVSRAKERELREEAEKIKKQYRLYYDRFMEKRQECEKMDKELRDLKMKKFYGMK